jgi:hypothetical protein
MGFEAAGYDEGTRFRKTNRATTRRRTAHTQIAAHQKIRRNQRDLVLTEGMVDDLGIGCLGLCG